MLTHNQDFLTVQAAFPNVAKKIQLFWGEKEFLGLMDDLIHDNRGNRQGFPATVLFALNNLDEAHRAAHPRLYPEPLNAIDWR